MRLYANIVEEIEIELIEESERFYQGFVLSNFRT